LRENAYTVVSLDQVREAQKNNQKLPEKSVVLTFDDGFTSFYHTIYPLLRLYKYPATFAIVTNWIENENEVVTFGNKQRLSKDFLTWKQIKEMSDSGLIEIASHSHNLHKGVVANPQKNLQPATTSRIFSSNYESDEEYIQRVDHDMQKAHDLIEMHTGKAPKTLAWPYGSYSLETWNLAQAKGFETSLILGEGENTIQKSEHINRFLIDENPSLDEFKQIFQFKTHKFPQRVLHVDLDYVYDKDPIQQENNIGLLLDRVKKMSVSTVYLQAYSDADGDGNADALYFENKHLPVKADLFNRVAWQLRTRSGVKVFAWLPVSAFVLPPELQNELSVMAWENGSVKVSSNDYKRLSIFNQQAKEIIFSIYDSFAKYNKVAGVLYHDDAFLTDFEDLSPLALAYYRNAGLEFTNAEQLIKDRSLADAWAQIKTNALIDFTNQLSDRIRQFRPDIKTARNIYALPITNTDSEKWFAQNFEKFILNYDYTAVMAMPYMEQQRKPLKWLKKLARSVTSKNLDMDKIVFELQSKDWRTNTAVSNRQLIKQMKLLKQEGIANFGYYPDDFIKNHPDIDKIMPYISLATFPYIKK
jgi:biofilm PGA synthesis lipoprotein PgaB